MKSSEMNRPLVFLAFLLIALGAHAAEIPETPASETLDLSRVIDLVKANNAQLKQLRLQVSRAEAQVGVARTRAKPTIGTYLLASHLLDKPEVFVNQGGLGNMPPLGPFPPQSRTFSESGRNSLYSLISITQPITQLRDIRTGVRMSETVRELTREKANEGVLEMVCETKKLYCTILALGNARSANQTAIALFAKLAETLDALVREGYAQKADLLDVQARLAHVRAREEELSKKQKSLSEMLCRLSGLPPNPSLNLAPLPEPSLEPLEIASESSVPVGDHPLVRQGSLQKKLASYDEKLKKGEFRPHLSLHVNRLEGHQTVDFLSKKVTMVGLMVSWNPFDWGRRKHELRDKRMAREQAEIALAETENMVRETIRSASRHVGETGVKYLAAREKRLWAAEQARVYRNKLTEKAILPKDVLEAEAELAEADFQQHQTCLDLWIAHAELEKALGGSK